MLEITNGRKIVNFTENITMVRNNYVCTAYVYIFKLPGHQYHQRTKLGKLNCTQELGIKTIQIRNNKILQNLSKTICVPAA